MKLSFSKMQNNQAVGQYIIRVKYYGAIKKLIIKFIYMIKFIVENENIFVTYIYRRNIIKRQLIFADPLIYKTNT